MTLHALEQVLLFVALTVAAFAAIMALILLTLYLGMHGGKKQ